MKLAPITPLGGVLLFTGMASAQDAKQIERGAKLYVAQKCSVCQSIAGKANPKGPLDGDLDALAASVLTLKTK